MKPKMVILNSTEYYEFFDQAIARSLEQKHQEALNLLLELKEKRWIRFDLFKMIAEEYMALGQYDESQIMINKLNPLNEEQKQELIELQETLSKKWALAEYQLKQQEFQQNQLNQDEVYVNEQIFQQTVALKEQNESLLFITKQKAENLNLMQFVFLKNLGYFCTMKDYVEKSLIFDPTKMAWIAKLGSVELAICLENYKQALILLDQQEENYETLFIRALCYLQLKQYKLALSTFRRSFDLNQNKATKLKLQYLHSILGLEQFQLPAQNNFRLTLYILYCEVNKQMKVCSVENQLISIHQLKQFIIHNKNLQMFLYHELFLMEYHISIYNPILQRICDFLIKYAPKYSAGYANQYQLLIDQKQMDKAFALEQPLLQCEDCTLKFITLAKLYKEQSKFLEAHKAIEKVRQIDPFKEEIYQIQSEVFMGQKKYQQAYQSIRQLVELEKENYKCFHQIIPPMIHKYEFYKVFDLLQLCDKESEKLNELRLLMKIISYKTDQEEQLILESIQSLNYTLKMIYLGHYWLSKNKIIKAFGYYDQIEFRTDYKYADQRNESMNQIRSIGIIRQHEIMDIICQISIINYIPSQDKYNLIHKRYVDTIGFVLVSLIYNERKEENINFLNSQYDMEVPKIEGLKQSLTSIIERIYCKNYITSEKYQGYLENGRQQLQILFVSTELFLKSHYKFSDQHKQQIIEQLIDMNGEIIQLNEDIQSIFSLPFFSDPISRYALISVIKMIGYFIDFELVNNYQKLEEWLDVYLIKRNFEAYYKVISQAIENEQHNG